MDHLTAAQLKEIEDLFRKFCFPQANYIHAKFLEKFEQGWETEIFVLDLTVDQTLYPVVIRILHGKNSSARATHEARSMQMLEKIGVDVPNVYFSQGEFGAIGRGYIAMERIYGDKLGDLMGAPGPQSAKHYNQLVQTFVDLHNMPWDDFHSPPFDTEAPHAGIDYFLELYTKQIEEAGFSELQPLIEWLEQQKSKVSAQQLAICHNDYHPDNIIVTSEGRFVILDWSAARVYDFRFDLAWSLLLSRLYSSPGDRDRLFAAYQMQSMKKVENIEFFEMMGCTRRLVDISFTLLSDEMYLNPETRELLKTSQRDSVVRLLEFARQKTGLTFPQLQAALV